MNVDLLRFYYTCHVFSNCITLLLDLTDAENRGKQSSFITYLIIFLNSMELGYYAMSSVHFLLVAFRPCQPGLSSYLLYRLDMVWQANFLLRLLTAALEFCIFMQICVSAGYYAIILLLTGTIFIWMACETFIKRYEREAAQQVEYRRVQILEKLLNFCTRAQIFFMVALILPTFQIIIFSALINVLHAGHQFIAVALVFIYLCTLSFTLLTFTAAAKVYTVSKFWIAKCKGVEKKKYSIKLHKSLRPLRMQFGNNFVEILTPLVVQEFCLRQTISLLLMSK